MTLGNSRAVMKETKHKNRVTVLKLTCCLVMLFVLLGSPAAAKNKAKNPNPELVGELSKEP